MAVANGQDADEDTFNAAFLSRTAATSVTITDGQAATSVSGESVDGTVYKSRLYEYQLIRGTTVFGNGRIAMQYLNATWRVVDLGYAGEDHGLTFSVTQSTTFGQLKIAADSVAGNGTWKYKTISFPA